MKKLTAEYEAAIRDGNIDKAREITPQIEKQQKEFQKLVDPKSAGGNVVGDAVKAIGIGQIANAINEGFASIAGSFDRSGAINQFGSGDILGGRISEQKRKANLWGGLAQAGLGIGGTILGFALGGPDGAMLGGTLGAAGGKAINTALGIPISDEQNQAAYAGLWENQTKGAMNLAAMLGDPSKETPKLAFS